MKTKMAGFVAILPLIAASAIPAIAQETEYPLTVESEVNTFTVEAPPQRAVGIGLQTIEMLLALGLKDRMVGVAFNSNAVLDEYRQAYESIPYISEGNPALEVLLSIEPDFAIGSEVSFTNIAPFDTLEEYGIAPMVPASNAGEATIEDVYDDLRTLGLIFGVQPRAEELIAEMQAEIAEVQATLGEVQEPLGVFIFSSDPGINTVLTPTASVQADLIRLAGGYNIFEDLGGILAEINLEEMIARDPDIIIITDPYGSTTAEEKIAFLESNPALASVTAIRESRYVLLPSTSRNGGVRNADTVRLLAESFYPELFDQ